VAAGFLQEIHFSVDEKKSAVNVDEACDGTLIPKNIIVEKLP